MLNIYTKAGGFHPWNVGEKIPQYLINTVELIVADGEEYKWVVESFQNLPIVKNATKGSWRNDFAKFIVDGIYQLTNSGK